MTCWRGKCDSSRSKCFKRSYLLKHPWRNTNTAAVCQDGSHVTSIKVPGYANSPTAKNSTRTPRHTAWLLNLIILSFWLSIWELPLMPADSLEVHGVCLKTLTMEWVVVAQSACTYKCKYVPQRLWLFPPLRVSGVDYWMLNGPHTCSGEGLWGILSRTSAR